jgi:hypothetical protein
VCTRVHNADEENIDSSVSVSDSLSLKKQILIFEEKKNFFFCSYAVRCVDVLYNRTA